MMESNDKDRAERDRLLLYHIVVPLIAAVSFFVIAYTPVQVLGCVTRGLLAIAVAVPCSIGAVVVSIIGSKARVRGDATWKWWLITSIILAIPGIGLLILA